MVCRIFRKAHGRSCSQKRLLWRGITLLSGAQTDLAYREINTLPQSTRFQRLPLTIRFPPAAPRRYSRASFIPPESCRGFPTDDVGQFWRTETGRFWSAPKLFQLERTISLETYARQCLLDASLRAYSEMPDEMRELTSYEKGLEKEKLWRSLQRDKKSHQSAYASHYKMFKQIRRDFPLVPPEPISTDADQNGAAPALPTPEVVKEMLDHADRAKNEPNYQLPRWVANMLLDDEMMAEIAPSYDVTALLEKLTVTPVPLAA